MEFRQLEYFVALAREQHFARAAASCYVSQPALSAAISKLERELDVSLIQRDRAFQGLTPEGERLVDWARRIIAERDALQAEAHAVRSGLTGTLRIGVVPTASTTVALPVEAFCAAHPRVTVRVRTRMSEDDIRRCLREFELDAAITYLDWDDTSGLSVEPLYRERYVLIAPARLVDPAATSITWRAAATLPLALIEPRMHSRELIERAWRANALMVTPQLETDSIAMLYAAAGTGRWASIVPHSWVHAFGLSSESRVVLLTEPELTATVGIARSAAVPGSSAARAFVSLASRLNLDTVLDLAL